MRKPGKRGVVIIVITFLFLYAAAWITGLAKHQLLMYVSVVNAVAGLLTVSYWVWDKLRPLQRMTERREIIFLSLEGLFVSLSLYCLVATRLNYWLTVVQYIVFAFHAVLLVLFLLFILTFKMKRLF